MADISAWSPVDESNTAAPPHGWPENQQPSSVNNCARAMMGATRRWYDTVTAQLSSLTSSLANYLPLSGGVTSGNIQSPNMVVTGGYYMKIGVVDKIFAGFSGSDFFINDTNNQTALLLTPSGSYYRNGSHTFQDETGATLAAISAGGTFSSVAGVDTANIVASGNITASGTVTAAQLTSTGNITATGTVTGAVVNSNGAMSAAGNITATGQITGGALVTGGNASISGSLASGAFTGSTIHANSTLSSSVSVAAPTIAASGALSGLNISSTNSISAGTWINAPQYRLSGVPIEFGAMFAELADLRARVAVLEAA